MNGSTLHFLTTFDFSRRAAATSPFDSRVIPNLCRAIRDAMFFDVDGQPSHPQPGFCEREYWSECDKLGQLLKTIPFMPQDRISISFRHALDQDFDYCKRLYFGETDWIIKELHLERAAQSASFQQQWEVTQVRIIALDGSDVGWFQTIAQDDELFVAQMFVDRPFQRRGIGTEVMKRLIDEAARANQTVRLNVVKINPAVRL